MMNGLRGFATTPIDALDFITNMAVIVFLCKLGGSAIR